MLFMKWHLYETSQPPFMEPVLEAAIVHALFPCSAQVPGKRVMGLSQSTCRRVSTPAAGAASAGRLLHALFTPSSVRSRAEARVCKAPPGLSGVR